jgi:amino acid adenylation domain-containing protein
MVDLSVGRDLVRRWRAGNRDAAPPAAGPGPVSKTERGILVFERLRPGTAVFNLRFGARHAGPLDEDRLDSALSLLYRRHPVLRGTFVDGDDGPVRVIADDATLAVRWTDLRDLPPDRRRATALDRAARAATEPFDLAAGPLVRVYGYRLADDERLLLFTAHHLVCDGGSMRVLLGELDDAYRGNLTGVAPGAAPAPVAAPALDYWLTHLADLPELDLPTDRPRPPDATFRGGSAPVAVPPEVVAAADELARREGTTLFTVVLAAFQLLLAHHSGQTDFAIGSPEAGRSGPGRHGAVGLLSDLLVLRTDLSGRPSFRTVVRRARDTLMAALAHRGVPFEDLVAALAPGRNVGGALVRASIAFQGDWGVPTLAGAPLEQVAVTRPGIRYDVDLQLWRERGGLWGAWDYNADTYDPTTATRMADRLPVLLARALADPDRPIDRLDPLTGEERDLLAGWVLGDRVDDPDLSLTELFTTQAAGTPDAIAIEDSRRRLTYRELDQRSNQLAHYLRGRAVEAQDIVGMRLGRSVDLAVAMLGIMKAGAAYMPLDPAYPADRTDYMVRDSRVRTIVTDADLAALDGQPTSAPAAGPVPPQRVAYVLYTSGSTGRPKGVLLTHRNAVAMVLWSKRTFPAEQLARVLGSTSVSFDVSAFEFFVPLCAGGTVVLVDNALSLLADAVDVTMICAVPSAVRALVAADALPSSTRVVCLAGEAVTGTLGDDLYAAGHLDAVLNLYGATEDTTHSTLALLHPGEQPPPIGGPIDNGRCYLLNEALRQVPVGAVGELYLAGHRLSLGYLNQPGLTASRFVADPFTATAGERMYRTGDIARYRSDGSLLYLGRRDFQVKVRGQRIELGEIETVLQRHPAVSEAVVALRDGRLVGYLTSREAGGPDLGDVRAYLRRTLPVVMVPGSLVLLDALPRTPNDKVNRRALPAPDAPVAVGGEPPRGDDEELVAQVWREVLDLETVGRHDDFFDLGGDSLKAGEVLSRLRQRARQSLPLRLVFDNSRLADLAAALPRAVSAGAADVIPRRSPDAPPLLSYEQQRIWLECQVKAAVAYNVHGRQWLSGPLDVPALDRSFRAVIARHESLRTTFPLVRGLPVQRVAEPGEGRQLAVDDLTGLGAGAVAAAERLADSQAGTAFDTAAGPLFHCLLVRVAPDEYLLSMTIHHLIADAWSVGVILGELSVLYRAGGDPERAGLAPLPVQYRDYAVWQRTTMVAENLAEPLAYWRTALAGAPPALALPTARRRRPAQETVGGKVSVALGADEVAALHKLCRVHGVTPFMAMLAALATVLRRWSGQVDVVVGVPVNTRAAAGTGGLAGLFVNTVPLRVVLAGDPSFAEVLGRVRGTAVDGYVNHGQTPFEVLVKAVQAVRDPARTPLFQVLLNMIESAEDAWQLPGIAVRAAEDPAQPSKFDLNLDVHHNGDNYRLDLSYHAERFAGEAMRALLDQLRALLAAAADDPSRGLLEYELADPRDPAPATRPPARSLGLAEPDRLVVANRHLADASAVAERLAAERAKPGAGTIAVTGADPGLLMCALSDALSGGAALVVADARTAGDPGVLETWLRDTGATAVYLAAPLLRTLAPRPGSLPGLRYAYLDNRGDLTAHDVELVRRLAPGCRFVALYRPGADGVPIARYEVPEDWSPTAAPLRVPLGSASAGRSVALHNPAGRRAAAGEVAELWVDAVRAPDLVRRRPDGLLEFAGVPGADPLETVAVLRDLPDVRDAVVTPYRDAAGEAALAAYVVCDGSMVDLGRLRQRLVTHLPAYLIPRSVVPVERLPRTATDDYDLAALPAPGTDR